MAPSGRSCHHGGPSAAVAPERAGAHCSPQRRGRGATPRGGPGEATHLLEEGRDERDEDPDAGLVAWGCWSGAIGFTFALSLVASVAVFALRTGRLRLQLKGPPPVSSSEPPRLLPSLVEEKPPDTLASAPERLLPAVSVGQALSSTCKATRIPESRAGKLENLEHRFQALESRQCCQLCQDESGCEAWSWLAEGDQGGCWVSSEEVSGASQEEDAEEKEEEKEEAKEETGEAEKEEAKENEEEDEEEQEGDQEEPEEEPEEEVQDEEPEEEVRDEEQEQEQEQEEGPDDSSSDGGERSAASHQEREEERREDSKPARAKKAAAKKVHQDPPRPTPSPPPPAAPWHSPWSRSSKESDSTTAPHSSKAGSSKSQTTKDEKSTKKTSKKSSKEGADTPPEKKNNKKNTTSPADKDCQVDGKLPELWNYNGSKDTKWKVLTYNLFWWNLFGVRNGDGDSAAHLIEKASKSEPFDLMGFQECENVERVLKPIGLLDKYHVFSGRGKTEAICIAARKKSFKLLGHGMRRVGEDGKEEYFGSRSAQWMRLRHLKTGDKVFFMNHHGPVPVNSGGKCGGRVVAHKLLQIVAAEAKKGDAVILAGDFNAGDGSSTIRHFEERLKRIYHGTAFGGIDNFFTNMDPKSVSRAEDLGSGGSDHDALSVELQGETAPSASRSPSTSQSPSASQSASTSESPSADQPAAANDKEARPAKCGLKDEGGVRYTGLEGEELDRVESSADCCIRCSMSSSCRSWTWTRNKEWGVCSLWFKLPGTRLRKEGFVSGLPKAPDQLSFKKA